MNDVIGFIRTIGERTEKVCQETIAREVPVNMVRNMPLPKTVVHICTNALESGKPWTLYADADYIPREGFVADFYEVAQQCPPEVMAVKGIIKDKFMLEKRGDTGGPILYRTHLFQRWLDVIDKVDNGRTTETQCYRPLLQSGYRWERTKIYAALHDFEQHYHHIYRSCFMYGIKQKGLRDLLPRWEELAKDDKDYEVCAYAFRKGLEYEGDARADLTIDYGFSKSPFKDWTKEPL